MTCLTVLAPIAYANETNRPSCNYYQPPGEDVMHKVIDIISEEIVIDSDGIKIQDEETILRQLSPLDFKALEELAKSQGIVYQDDLTAERILETFRDGIKSINYEISSGDLVVLAKGTIVDANDAGFYIQGGVTYDQTFWWGKKI